MNLKIRLNRLEAKRPNTPWVPSILFHPIIEPSEKGPKEIGAFVHDPASSALDFRAAADKAKRVFLELLEECLRNGQNVNANGSSTYAPSVFAKHTNSERVTKASFKTAMQGLLAEGVIESEKWGRVTRLVMSK